MLELFNLSEIKNLSRTNRDEFIFEYRGMPVKVGRRMSDWDTRLVVVINYVNWHDATPEQSDIEVYSKLSNLCYQRDFEIRDERLAKVREIFD